MSDSGDLLLDDCQRRDLTSRLGTSWRLVSDQVMGGVSVGKLGFNLIAGRRAIQLSGVVDLENNGGFIQAALDLSNHYAVFDASAYQGIRIVVYGNGEIYNLHLRSPELQHPWQSWRASFTAPPEWSEVKLRLADFRPHRHELPFNPARLSRLGIVAIGRPGPVDIAWCELALYRDG